jgi:protein pelota
LRVIEKDLKKGAVKVVPESADDLWHLYNVIYKNDCVYAYSTREIRPDDKYGRPDRGERIRVFLGVKVAIVGWDKLLGRLRVHGTICQAPETVPMGVHHTVNIVLNAPVTIVKDKWGKAELDRVDRARKSSEKPVIIMSIDDEGYVIATTAQYGVEERVAERVRLPGKLEAENRMQATHQYFRKAVDSLRQVLKSNPCPVVIVGLGFVKNDFARFARDEASDVAGSIVDVKGVNNSGLVGINEALRSGVLLKAMKRLRITEETEVVEEVLKRLGKGESTVAYGADEVKKAVELGAVEKLLIADSVLREASDEDRLRLEDLMSDVERKHGVLMVVSSEHEGGDKLLGLGGLAAILRFPLRAG